MGLVATNMMDTELLERLLRACGIGTEFIDFSGNVVHTPLENRLHILDCMGYRPGDPEELDLLLAEAEARAGGGIVDPLIVGLGGRPLGVPLRVPETQRDTCFRWWLLLEDGGSRDGELVPGEAPQPMLEFPDLPLGYHRLSIGTDTDPGTESLIIVAPETAWQSPELNAGKRMWGLSAQLYTLRSDSDWGIGDFADLKQLCGLAAARGADFVLLNPLHCPDLRYPDNASPYSPGDRRFLNPLYIHLPWCEDYQDDSVGELVSDADFRGELARARDDGQVCYSLVARLKLQVLEKMYLAFKERFITDLYYLQYQYFARKGGAQLVAFARFQADCLRERGGVQVEPGFHIYLQWLAQQQLQECQRYSLEQGMALGLVQDLAVGSIVDGCEVQTNLDQFCLQARIGAPPDNFNPDGQNWGLPPLRPERLLDTGCSHIRSLLRANMRHCGALRIDHVMSLMRLWWCPDDGSNATGAYVYYPFEALMAILKLESVRHRCVVIGEDLGVVPPEIRGHLEAACIFSNCVFYFEKYDGWHFRKPEHYKPRALAMVTNHDVPPLLSWWSENDLQIRFEIGLIPSEQKYREEVNWRRGEKRQILLWLREQGLLPEGWSLEDGARELDGDLKEALMRSCGRFASGLVSVQLDDLAGSDRPINIPGTHAEYANWRRKLPLETESIFESTIAVRMMQAMHEGRVA